MVGPPRIPFGKSNKIPLGLIGICVADGGKVISVTIVLKSSVRF